MEGIAMAQTLDVERPAVRSLRIAGVIDATLCPPRKDALRTAAADEAVDGLRLESLNRTGNRGLVMRLILASALLRVSWATVSVRSLRGLFRKWAKRRRDRLELLDYLAQDHRSAADMGTTRADADYWAQQPFWRP
jgi:uncharacterized protein YjiS (DUF1127 family)